jgi:hypothetical protein
MAANEGIVWAYAKIMADGLQAENTLRVDTIATGVDPHLPTDIVGRRP